MYFSAVCCAQGEVFHSKMTFSPVCCPLVVFFQIQVFSSSVCCPPRLFVFVMKQIFLRRFVAAGRVVVTTNVLLFGLMPAGVLFYKEIVASLVASLVARMNIGGLEGA